MNTLQRWEALYADWERKVKAEGRKDALQEIAQREQQLREEGRREAEQLIAQREQQLREDSVRHVLLDLLGERFGALPADAVERIERAGLDDLERWTRRVVRAQTLADVLAA